MDSVKSAIILAGGLGTRLKSVSGDTPKPLMPINDKVFLDFLIDNLKKYNINNIYLSISYNYEIFLNYYKNTNLKYIIEETPMGTGGAIKMALQKINENNILILNGDTFFDINYNNLINKHLTNNYDITIATKSMNHPYRYGTIEVKDDNIIQFKEKCEIDVGIINCGIYVVNSRILNIFPSADKFSFEKDVLEKYTNQLKIIQQNSDGYFIDIGIPEDYQKAIDYFRTK